MVRIVGIDIPSEKRVDIGLTYIYGIGRKNVVEILAQAKIDSAKRVKDLNNEEITRLQKIVEEIPIEGVLRKNIAQDIERLKLIKSYRGIRHLQELPVRGQRTRTNARTKRGKRKTVGTLKKKEMIRLKEGSKNEG